MESFIIGISGPAGAGKSTIAKHICENYFATRVSFADPIRDMLRPVIDLLNYDKSSESVEKALTDDKEELIKELQASPRYLMQQIGGLFREINPNSFVNLADKKIEMLESVNQLLAGALRVTDRVPVYGYIIDDVRYDNEALWVRDMKKGYVVRIERPEHLLKEVPEHHSERGINRDFVSFEYQNSDNPDDAIAIANKIATHCNLTPIPDRVNLDGKMVMPMENKNVH